MHELASRIRNALDDLAGEYEQQLRTIEGYAALPDEIRLEAARSTMQLIATGLEAGDHELFGQSVQAIALEQMAQGVEIEAMQQAMEGLAEVLESRLPDVESARFFWRAMIQAHAALSQVAMDQMRAAESRSRYMADNLGVGLLVHRDGIVHHVSREGVRLLGYDDPKEILGQSFMDFVHPDEREYMADIARRHVAGEPVPDYHETRMLKKDGTGLAVEVRNAILQFQGQTVMQAAFIDITGRKRVEEALQASEERFRKLVEESSDVFFITDANGICTYINPRGPIMTGYAQDEIIGMHFTELISDEWKRRVMRFYLEQFRDRTPETIFEFPFQTKDGQTKWVEQTAQLLTEGDRITGFQCSTRDITKRRETEEALWNEKMLIDTLLDSTTDSIYIKDLQCRHTRVNQVMADDLNLDDVSELLGKTDADLYGEEYGRQTMADERRIMETGEPIIGKVEGWHMPGGGINWTSTTKFPLRDADGKIVGLGGITREINALVEAEEMARRHLADLGAVVEAMAELSAARSADDLCRRAVELGREKLGIDRLSIWLVDDVPTRLRGTFGTDEDGQIRDERDMISKWEEDPSVARIITGQSRVEAYEAPLRDGHSRVVGTGWKTEVPLERQDGTVFGLLGADSLLSGEKWDEYTTDILRLYGLSVGYLLDGLEAREALQESVELFRSVVENSPAGILIMDDIYRLSYVNDEVCRIVGYPREELLDQKFPSFLDEQGQKLVVDRSALQQRGEGRPAYYELNVVRKDGEKRQVEITSSVIEDSQGRMRALAQLVDVTERRQSEAEQRRLLGIIESSTDFISIATPEGQVLYVNPTGLAMTGYTVQEFDAGMSVFDFQPEMLQESIETAVREGAWAGEATLAHKDGRRIQISQVITALKDGEGNLQNFATIARDITKRKRLEQEVQESLERRGRQVQISTEISQEIAAAPVLDELYRRIVSLIKEQFDYYHAQLFLLNEEGDKLISMAGYGEVGRRLVADGHFVPVGKGVVGATGAEGRTVLAPDVSQVPGWLYHPFLPDTKGELAVPIILHDRVLGVLDVQSDKIDVLTDDDRILLEGLCGQIAIAIESTRLRQETEGHLSELERLTRAMSREGWKAYRREAGPTGYLFDQTDVAAVSDLWEPEIRLAAERQTFIEPGADDQPVAVAPLSVRGGEFIGVLGVQDDPQAPLSRDDLALVEAVSEQVAQALESARLFEETQHRATELDAINEVGRAITSVLDLDTVIRQIVDTTKERFGHYFVGLGLVEGDKVVFHSGSTIGDSEARLMGGSVGIELTRGTGLIAAAARTGQPVLVNDVLDDPRYLSIPELADTHAELCVPIEVMGRVIGVLTVQSDRRGAYDQTDVALLQSLASQAGVALENARLFEESEQRIAELAVLNEIGRTASASLEMDQFFEIVHQQVERVFDTDSFFIVTYEEGGHEWVAAFSIEKGERSPVLRRPVGAGITGQILQNRRSLLFRSTDEILAFHQERGLETVGELAQSWMGVPLLAAGKAIGVMAVQSYEHAALYNERDMGLLETIADQVSLALESARLFEETQTRAEELAVLNEMSRVLASTMEVEVVAENVYQYTSRLMDTTSCYIARYHPDRDEISFPLAVERGERVQWNSRKFRAGLTEHLIQAREPLLIPEDVAGKLDELGVEAIGDIALSWLGVPLVVGGQVLGVVAVQSYTTPRLYGERERDLLTAIASSAAIALQNARLFERTQQTARELGRERTLLRTLIDTMPAYVYAKDRESRFVVNNAAHLRVIGATAQEEVMGKTDFDVFPHEYAAQYYADEQELIQSGMPLLDHEEVLIDQNTGEMQWVSVSKVPLRDATGEITGVVGVTQNITERKAAQETLERRRAQLQCLSDLGQKIGESVLVSEFLQWTAERIPAAMQHPELCQVAIQFEDRSFGATEAIESPHQMVQSLHIGGERVGRITIAYTEDREFLNEESALLGDIARRVSGYIENRRLLEETQQTAQTLTYERDLLQALMDNSPDYIFFKDRELRFVRTNHAHLEILGASHPQEVIGKTDFDLFPEEDAQRLYAEELEIMESRQPVLGREWQVPGSEGEVRWISEHKVPMIDRQGQVFGLVGIGRDVTASVQTESEMQDTLSELERLTRAMSREGWQSFRHRAGAASYLFDRFGVVPAGDLWVPEIKTAAERGVFVPSASEAQPIAIAPLSVRGGEFIGVLGIEDNPENPLSEDELALIEEVSGQIAQALESSRLFDDAQTSAEEQAVLNEMGQALAASQDVDGVLGEAYRGASRLLNADDLYIALYDADSGDLVEAMDVIGGQITWPYRVLRGRKEFTEFVIRGRKSVIAQGSYAEWAARHGVELYGRIPLAAIGAPLLVGDEVLGIIAVRDFTSPRAYDEHDRALLTAVASPTAIALQNVRLLERTQAALAEVQAAHRSYLRRGWQEHLRQREVLERSSFLYDRLEAERREDVIAAPNFWRPEIEHAVVDGGPAVAGSDEITPEGDGGRAGLAVPIVLRGQTLGVIGVEVPDGDRRWTKDEIAIIEAVSEQLGQILESARLFADTQRRAERELRVREITDQVRAAFDLETLAQTAAEELAQTLGASQVVVRLRPTSAEKNSGK